ncbi:MAG: hypothetical protein CFE26_22260, partial [Verrucomicrobiales bacterium VVV1]
LRERPPAGIGPRLVSDRADAYYALTRPFTPREWLTVTPTAGTRVTHYANTTGATAPGGYTRVLGEVGVDAALRASATYAYKNPQWKIDGLRHLVTPRLSYRYIPQGDLGRRFIPAIDRREPLTSYLRPLGLGDQRSIDDLRATNTLRLGTASGILMGSGTSALTLGTTVNQGTLTAGGNAIDVAGEILLANNSANTLTINSAIRNNGTGAVSLVKTG